MAKPFHEMVGPSLPPLHCRAICSLPQQQRQSQSQPEPREPEPPGQPCLLLRYGGWGGPLHPMWAVGLGGCSEGQGQGLAQGEPSMAAAMDFGEG